MLIRTRHHSLIIGQQQQQIRNPVNSKPDLSAFDSLLSPVSSQSKPSMNNMRGSGGRVPPSLISVQLIHKDAPTVPKQLCGN